MSKKMNMSSGEADRIQSIVEGVDHIANEMELKWGRGRLPLLVDNEMRERFNRQRRNFNDAVWSFDCGQADIQGQAMIRGWQALDRQATDARVKPLDPEVWEVRKDDGAVVAIVRTNAEASRVVADGRHLQVWTLDEIVRVMAANALIGKAKEVFPGVIVEGHRTPRREELNDDIPLM